MVHGNESKLWLLKINPRVSFIIFVWSNFAAWNQSSFKIIFFSLKESKYEWHWKWKPGIFLLLCRGTLWQKSRDPNTQNRCLFLKRADNAFMFSGCSNYVIKQRIALPLNILGYCMGVYYNMHTFVFICNYCIQGYFWAM